MADNNRREHSAVGAVEAMVQDHRAALAENAAQKRRLKQAKARIRELEALAEDLCNTAREAADAVRQAVDDDFMESVDRDGPGEWEESEWEEEEEEEEAAAGGDAAAPLPEDDDVDEVTSGDEWEDKAEAEEEEAREEELDSRGQPRSAAAANAAVAAFRREGRHVAAQLPVGANDDEAGPSRAWRNNDHLSVSVEDHKAALALIAALKRKHKKKVKKLKARILELKALVRELATGEGEWEGPPPQE
jgi:hypothetical protein